MINSINDQFNDIQKSVENFFKTFGFSAAIKVRILRGLANPLRVGRPLSDIIDFLYFYGDTKTIRAIASDMRKELANTGKISPALEEWFTNSELAVIRTSESGGSDTLPKGLLSLADQIESQASQGKASLTSLAYPTLIFVGSSFGLIHLYGQLGSSWDALGQTGPAYDRMRDTSGFYETQWLTLIIIIFVVTFIWKFAAKNYTGPFRTELDNTLFSGERLKTGARFISVYSLLKRYGLSLNEILLEAQKDDTKYMKYHISMMNRRMSAGGTSEVSYVDTGLLTERDIATLQLYSMAAEEHYADALDSAVKTILDSLMARGMIITLILKGTIFSLGIYNILVIIMAVMS